MDPKLLKTFKELGDIYRILGIESTKDEKIIKKAYKQKAKELHPDKNKASNAKEMYIHLKQAYDILIHPEMKAQYDKYKDNQKYHEEKVSSQNKVRRQFGEELLKKEKANQDAGEAEKQHKMTKEEEKRQEGKRMKKEWDEEEEKRKEELKKRKIEKTESKEYTMIKIKWPKSSNMTYTADILRILFGKYGEIVDLAVFPTDRKAVIEFRYRLSAEKAYQENKAKEKEKMGFDDGLKISLLVKEKAPDQSTGPNNLNLNSGNLEKISNLYNRDSKVLLGSREEELRREQERQRIMEEMLAKEGIV